MPWTIVYATDIFGHFISFIEMSLHIVPGRVDFVSGVSVEPNYLSRYFINVTEALARLNSH